MNTDARSLTAFQKVGIISTSLMLIFLQLLLFCRNNIGRLHILQQYNMAVYGCAIFLWVTICLIGSIKINCKRELKEVDHSNLFRFSVLKQKRIFALAIAMAVTLWFNAEFFAKENEFAVYESILFQVLQNRLIQVLYCISCICLMAFVICYAKRKRDVPERAVWITYLFVCASEFINKLFLDIFNMNGLASFGNQLLFADLYHGSAYRESIYNVYYGIPYTVETTGVYGHYGLFYKPLMHLFHGNPIALSLIIASTQVIAAICFLYVLHRLCSKNWIRCLGALAMGMPAVIWEHRNYWQACPHRILFPLIILAFFTFIARNNRWSTTSHVIAFILGMLAFIWNTETGIFCLIVICIVFAVHRWQYDKWFSPKTWAYECLLVMAAAASAVCGILCVNIYNIACGGSWILKDFFFPLFTENYVVGALGYSAPAGNYSWVYILLILVFSLLYCLNNTSFFCNLSEERYISIVAGASALGLLNMTYYMNRAAYGNLCIVIHFVVLALCYFSEKFLPHWQSLFQKSCEQIHLCKGIICVICVAMLTFCGINTLGILPKTCVTTGRFDTTQLIDSAENIKKSVPENTYAIGTGLTELYALLGWDTQAHFRDFPDLMVGDSAAFDAVLEETLQHDSFLFYSGSHQEGNELLDEILTHASYRLTAEIPIECGIVYYYSK